MIERPNIGLQQTVKRQHLRRWLFWVFATVPALSFGAAFTPFEFLGKFSNMTYSQEHQGGEDLYLWREQAELHGYMEYSLGGALGDYTTARLENVQFDAATRRLSFQAKNPLYDETGNVIRNLFVFDGFIRQNALEGTLNCHNATTREYCPDGKKVSWKKMTLENAEMYQMGNRQEWENHVNEQLKEHGARW